VSTIGSRLTADSVLEIEVGPARRSDDLDARADLLAEAVLML
jgi:hypothetical protein